MKILAIGPVPNSDSVSGLAVAFEMAAVGLRQRGHQVTVIDTAPFTSNHVSGKFRLGRFVELLTVLVRSVASMRGCDLVYVPLSTSSMGVLKDLVIGVFARLFGKRLIGHLHGGGEARFFEASSPLFRRLISWERRLYQRIIVLGEKLRAQYDYLEGAVELVVVPNGLPEESEPDRDMQRAWAPGHPINILYLSNLVPSKGYLELLEACAVLKRQGLGIRCEFCGAFVHTVVDGVQGDPEAEFRARVAALGLEQEVHFRGLVFGDDKRAVLRDADVFVLPTSYPWEGQPISIIEAMSWKLPVVSTQHKGIPEQVEQGKNGVLLPVPVEPEQLAAAIRQIFDSAQAYARFVEEASRKYQREFTRERFISRLEDALL